MGGIFNNRLLFENNRLWFYLLFSGNFCGGTKSWWGDLPIPPQEKTFDF